MYPLRFENLYYDKIWGGRDFELFRDNLPNGSIGESWDIACHPHGISVISNGVFKGMKLDELINLAGDKLLGTKISKYWFPLLIKLINAKDNLSVQVHPDDKYAKQIENEMGKTEAWYIVEALEGANIVLGFKKRCTKNQLKEAIERGTLEEYMNRIPVRKGDVYFVKSGLIHAIGEGVIIAEVQQNSDTTYRVYDYNRGRELHIEKALDVINLDLVGKKVTKLTIQEEGFTKSYLYLCKDFSLELYDVETSFSEKSDKERFYTFTCVEGSGKIIYKNREENINKGDSMLIPAFLGEYTFKGTMNLLKSYVPDIKKVENEILSYIKN